MRINKLSFAIVSLFIASVVGLPLLAQMSGSRGGVSNNNQSGKRSVASLPNLSPESVQTVITIDGKYEMRLQPTEIRIVLALTSEGTTSTDCRKLIKQQLEALKPGWIDAGIAPENIVEDFIAVLPRYQFVVESMQGQEVAVEKKSGYLMQTNIHLSVKNDAEAMKALEVAFAHGVTDIIGFDYWSSELNEAKQTARKQALQIAKQKSEFYFEGFFDKQPPLMNFQETNNVYYPEAMYESFNNSASSEYRSSYSSHRNLPQIRLYRPKNTYYRGLYPGADVQSNALPMKSEISVVATVRLFFESPAAKEYRESQKDD